MTGPNSLHLPPFWVCNLFCFFVFWFLGLVLSFLVEFLGFLFVCFCSFWGVVCCKKERRCKGETAKNKLIHCRCKKHKKKTFSGCLLPFCRPHGIFSVIWTLNLYVKVKPGSQQVTTLLVKLKAKHVNSKENSSKKKVSFLAPKMSL